MSESNLGKKFVKEAHLRCFLDAYTTVTGTTLSFLSAAESPDFTCARPSGELVGIELARSPHDYEIALHDRIWTDRTMESYDLLESIGHIISTKEDKRKAPHWRTPNHTILVITLIDYCFDSLAWLEDSSLSQDYACTGFLEIWLADHSTLEAFGQVKLIGLYPAQFWGIRPQPALEGKPYR